MNRQHFLSPCIYKYKEEGKNIIILQIKCDNYV